MSTPILDAIDDIKTALEATNFRVYYPAPTKPIAPCFVIRDDNNWYEPASLSNSVWSVSLIIEALADPKQIDAGHTKAAEMQWAAMGALEGISTDRVANAPRLIDIDAQGTVMGASITATIKIKE